MVGVNVKVIGLLNLVEKGLNHLMANSLHPPAATTHQMMVRCFSGNFVHFLADSDVSRKNQT